MTEHTVGSAGAASPGAQRDELQHAAKLLAKSLTDEMINSLRPEWGHTNAQVLFDWKAAVLKALASLPPAEPPQFTADELALIASEFSDLATDAAESNDNPGCGAKAKSHTKGEAMILSPSRVAEIREKLHSTRPTDSSEPLDIDEARELLAALEFSQQETARLREYAQHLNDCEWRLPERVAISVGNLHKLRCTCGLDALTPSPEIGDQP